MSIFGRIGNLARGVWIVKTRPSGSDPTHEARLERELADAPRPAAAPLRRELARVEAPAPEPPATPIELDADGHVKRTL